MDMPNISDAAFGSQSTSMNISEAGFGSSGAGSSAFDKGLVQKNITEYQRKIMEMTDQLAMLRAEQDLKERADKLQNAIQQMITGSRYLSYSKIKEVV